MAASSVVAAYHQRSKHQLQRYAAGPETLDWDAQPNPFRVWAGASLCRLPLCADGLLTTWADLAPGGQVEPRTLDAAGVSALLELSLGLTAWKQFGPDRWALRANPSSGNLHPIEAYVVAQGLSGLADGVHHYDPLDHALAHRHVWPVSDRPATPRLWLAFSLIQWREAWKYGERAFRYCELDAGHALGALRYAAAALGWQVCPVSGQGDAALAHLLGLDRDGDFGQAERELPVCLCQVGPALPAEGTWPDDLAGAWQGEANRLDRHPMYRWPVIDEVSRATIRPAEPDSPVLPWHPAQSCRDAGQARLAQSRLSALIKGRRSAQRFDRSATMPLAVWCRLMAALLPESGIPWDVWREPARVHPVVFAHRVDGLPAGAYLLVRDAAALPALQSQLGANLAWEPVSGLPGDLPVWRLADNPALAGTMRTLSCHQAIASDACVAVSMLATGIDDEQAPWAYRSVLQEAGLLGQVLYLQAEAEGFRGTGIGCYFDDAVHELLGMRGPDWQAIYHFTVGVPVTDERITTEPPYAHRS